MVFVLNRFSYIILAPLDEIRISQWRLFKKEKRRVVSVILQLVIPKINTLNLYLTCLDYTIYNVSNPPK